jgi:tetratricopeptide (TPR) repeat protein
MEVAAGARARKAAGFGPSWFDTRALSAWVLALAVILYLAFNNGGYDFTTHAQVAIAVWWVVTICAAWGLFPLAKPSRGAIAVVLLFAAFTAWTALGITWSISTGRSFQDLALIMCYLGILLLGICVYRDRTDALRHTLNAIGTAIVIVAIMALAARFWPNLQPGSQTAHWGGARISWPIGYWNAFAAFMALGLPVLLSIATTARTLVARSAAAAAIPVLIVSAALTQSRGGIAEVALALLVFILMSKDRVEKLATCVVAAIGSAVLIAAAFSRNTIKNALEHSSAQHHQAMTLLLVIVIVCLGVALAQAGISLALRHAALPRLLTPTVKTTRILFAAAIVVLIVAAIVGHVPHRIHHGWDDFKSTTAASSSGSHFSTTSGEGRYQFWVAGIDSAKPHPFTGSGPGTFQLDWLPRDHINQYVTNAHNLYVETYTELGIPGLLLLLAFFIAALTLLIRALIRSEPDDRARLAAVVAAFVAFLGGAAIDWIWQVAVIPAALLLLIAASLAGEKYAKRATEASSRGYIPHWGLQVAVVAMGLCGLAAVAYPLATNDAITSSQGSARAGQLGPALSSAETAVKLESGSASAQLQLALVRQAAAARLPRTHAYGQARQQEYEAGIEAALHAVHDEPQNWQNWYVLSELYTQTGQTKQAQHAYKQARRMYPTNPFLQPS